MIRWKVVKTHDNGSCAVPPDSRFYKTYPKETIVEALPTTLGICVFDTKEHAIDYISENDILYLIKRVKVIGKKKSIST